MLRIPSWSHATAVKVNDVPVTDVSPGTYLKLDRKWKKGDKIELAMDMSLHYWASERECDGLTSIYRGPILLTYDRYYNDMAPDNIPALDNRKMAFTPVSAEVRKRQPIVLLEFTGSDGRKLRLCDFGSAGYAGTPYKSWLKANNVRKTEFSRSNPLRS